MGEKEKIGAFLKELREEKNLTQEQLAKKIHVTNKAISNWETGRTSPDLETMITLAKLYDVTVDELYNGTRRDEKDIIFKRKVKKICIRIGISIFAILFLLLLTYFILTINSVKFYVLDIDDDSINATGSYYIVNKDKSILHLNKLELDNDISDSTYIELYEKNFDENKILYSGFYSAVDLRNVIINNIDEVYLKLVYTKDDEKYEGIYKINFQLKYINHKFVKLNSETSYDGDNNPSNKTELVDKLLDLDFEKQNEYLYFKEEKSKKEKITTYVDVNTYNYHKIIESKESKKFITYYKKLDTLVVQFLDAKDNIYKEFKYEVAKELHKCIIGRCNNTENIESLKEDIEIVKLFK